MDAIGDLYALLGISSTASQAEVAEAYRAAANRFHPDANSSPAASLIFDEIVAAYELLSNPDLRDEYDRSADLPANGQSSLDLSVMLSRQILPRLDEPQLIYAMVTLTPPASEVVARSGTLVNLGLVIDRSTSMKGPRLDQVKAATNQIIDGLQQDDLVSVVAFSDHAETFLAASHPVDRRTMKATVSTMRASGATAIYEGLQGGMRELSKGLHPRYVNHLVLITDGHTYGDEEACLELANQAYEQGISISAMGIGEDWNDTFLDRLASITGGSSAYIASHKAVNAFMEQHIRSLGTAYAERARLVAAAGPQVELDSIFKISPDPMPLGVDPQPIPLGLLDLNAPTSLILQFTVTSVPEMSEMLHLGRISLRADILRRQQAERALADLTVNVREGLIEERPPAELVEALNKVTLYNLQDHAREAMEEGNTAEATRALEFLATRLFEQGEEALATAAMVEAGRVTATQEISSAGGKHLKYGTRALVNRQQDAGV